MELIPAHTAAVLATALRPADRERLQSACAASGRQLGARVELDLDLLRARGEERMAALLARYHSACSAFWERERAGERPGPCVAVRRVLREAAQRDNAAGRADLALEYEALREVPGLGDLLEVLTDAQPERAALERLGAPLRLQLTEGVGTLSAQVSVDAYFSWPVALGGSPTPGEVRRQLALGVSYAKWRDRRVRRLTQVRAEAEELWPDPRGLLQKQPQHA